MNSHIVPEKKEYHVDQQTTLVLVLLLSLVMLVVGTLVWFNWHTWGETFVIVVGVAAGIPIVWRMAKNIHLQGWHHKDKVLEHKTQKLHHEAVTTALSKNYSVDWQTFPDGSYRVHYLSPWTIPRAPVEVMEVHEEQRAIAAPITADHLDISPEFKPHADEILSGRVTIFGVSGSGKSNTFADLSEELGRLRVPLLIADTEDEYQSLASPNYLPNAQTVDSSLVTVVNAEEFGRYILDARVQAILNLTDYTTDEAAMVLIGMIDGMWKWEEERQPDRRMSCMVMLDEASKWLPQKSSESVLSTDVQNDLFTCISGAVVSRGRKRGIGAVLANQRVATLNKDVLQPSVQILHRQTQDIDVKRYASMGITNDEVASMKDGEAFIFTAHVAKLRTRINMRRSPHGANTPGLASLRNGNLNGKSGSLPDFTEGDFHTENEPVVQYRSNTSTLPSFPYSTGNSANSGVPEEWKTRIVEKLRQGKNRDIVKTELGLSGDQYWMIRTVADEYDRQKRSR